jgi:hypothetical protein
MADVPTDPRQYLPGGPPQHRQAGWIAGFLDPAAARAAARDLEAAGYGPVSLDEVNPHPVDRSDLRQEAPGFPRTLTEEPESEEDRRVTAGPSDPLPRGRQSRTVTVLAVPREEGREEPALSIIRRHGGRFDGF